MESASGVLDHRQKLLPSCVEHTCQKYSKMHSFHVKNVESLQKKSIVFQIDPNPLAYISGMTWESEMKPEKLSISFHFFFLTFKHSQLLNFDS